MRRRGLVAAATILLGCGSGSSTPDAAAPIIDARPATDAPVPDAPPPLPPNLRIGVNLPFLLHGYLGLTQLVPETDTTARTRMDAARENGITFARFFATPPFPRNMTEGAGWKKDPDAYWATMDRLVADARARSLRLVPILINNLYLFSDLAGEPASKLFVPGSASRQLLERYVTELVTRYRDNDTILFWEIANELNLMVDIDVSTCTTCSGDTPNNCGGLAEFWGTPCRRTLADNIFSCHQCRGVSSAEQDLGQFMESMAALIRSLDPTREISSGHAAPRPVAYHLSRNPCPGGCDFTPDSEDEYALALAQQNPPGIDLVSAHVGYIPPTSDNMRFGDNEPSGAALIARTQAIVSRAGRKLYVGEIPEIRAGSTTCPGARETCGGDPERPHTQRILKLLVGGDVAYASLWALESYLRCNDSPDCLSVAKDDPILDVVAGANTSLGACRARPDGETCPLGKCAGEICTPPRQDVASFPLDSAAGVAAWSTFTNCMGCTPATFTFASGVARLETRALPCEPPGCTSPNALAASPMFSVGPGLTIVRYAARSAATDANLRIIAYDAADKNLIEITTYEIGRDAIEPGVLYADLPPTTAKALIRIDLPAANAILEVADLVVERHP